MPLKATISGKRKRHFMLNLALGFDINRKKLLRIQRELSTLTDCDVF
jgi:hypothetical protein